MEEMNFEQMRRDLRLIRKNACISLVHLAKEMGVHHITLSSFLLHGESITDLTAYKLMNYIEKKLGNKPEFNESNLK